jgi:hypothetical protein
LDVNEKQNIQTNMKSTLSTIKLEELKLDIKNPRFAELYSGSDDEDELIEYLLYNESAEELAKGINKAGEFYPDRPLWVMKNEDYYLIKDGNRRCAAVKALNLPTKYGLNLPKNSINELPVLIYNNKEDLETRILQEHTNSLFREWDRIAKALEVNKMYSSGSSIDTMKEIDSQPAQLIKLASFYYQAVKIGGDDLKKLLRRGRGKSGGKTIIFERLFSFSKLCGYSFRNKPSYKIVVNSKTVFESYIKALIQYLSENPKTRTEDVDREKEKFLHYLEPYGFKILSPKPDQITISSQHPNIEIVVNKSNENTTPSTIHDQSTRPSNIQNDTTQSMAIQNDSTQSPTSPTLASSNNINTNSTFSNRKSIKTRPLYTRKKIPATLDNLIRECYSIDASQLPNAKTALSRVTFECTLKYIMENTKYNAKTLLCNSNYFRNVFLDKNGSKKPFTDFGKLKPLFTELILNTGIKKAFENFDLEKTHQIIHNYHVGATYSDAVGICNNLIPLLEFMLQAENDLINSLDKSRL